MTLPRITLGTVVRVLIVCFLVGLALAFFGINPANILSNFGNIVVSVFDWSVEFFGWAGSYVILGAILVVPIWAIVFLLRMVRTRR